MKTTDTASVTTRVKSLVLRAGCHLVGITSAEPFERYPLRNLARFDPRRTLPGARAVVVGAKCYLEELGPARDGQNLGIISRAYATGNELTLVEEFEPAVRFLRGLGFAALVSPEHDAECTIPLKVAAARAGLGTIGKHSLLTTSRFGSWVTLGGFITDAPLVADSGRDWSICGRCERCLSVCPTAAMSAPYVIDRSRCLEQILAVPGAVPDRIKPCMGVRVLSCETCIQACPHSMGAARRVRARGCRRRGFDLLELLAMTSTAYAQFAQRLRCDVPYEAFLRNVVIALGNRRALASRNVLRWLTSHPDSGVRDAAAWSLEQLTAAHD